MAKISPVSAKYMVHSQIQIEGTVDRPDVIGAIFGQTEGLLGSELELRELQRSGRIGRIEVKSENRAGKTFGTIIIPSSLDRAETAIIGAALETIQRIGPYNSKIKIENIEDVRISKRNFVIERAKELLKDLTDKVLPDSQEITDEVASSVRMMEITEYGRDRLPAGPTIDENDEIIVVEGRADVLNLLKHGIKNVIAINGNNLPETIIELSKKKTITLFVDGDRGGDLIVREILNTAEIDFVTKAPDGKEVEEITKKEIHKALRSKIAVEQIKLDIERVKEPINKTRTVETTYNAMLSDKYKKEFRRMLEDLIGTRGAYILDQELNILGKVPTIELTSTMRNLKTAYAVVLDGTINKDIVNIAESSNVKFLVAMDSRVKPSECKTEIVLDSNL